MRSWTNGPLTVYPTYVGMNRYACRMMGSVRSIPHVCGDEPRRTNYTEIEVVVYPTYVGMNRKRRTKYMS